MITMRILSLLLLFVISIHAISFNINLNNIDQLYDSYIKQYPDMERYSNKDDFKKNLVDINTHNQMNGQGYVKGINKYSGLSFATFEKLYLKNIDYNCSEVGDKMKSYDSPVEKTWDWREQIPNITVRDQGPIGDSVVSTSLSAIEHHNYINNKVQRKLSQQQVIECMNGYNQSTPGDVFQYIKDQGGISYESDYPDSLSKGKCYYNYSQEGLQIVATNGSIRVFEDYGNEFAMQTAVRFFGPVTVMFQATSDFLSYSSGIYSSQSCGQNSTFNHALLVIGYGGESGPSGDNRYWLVQNSWGSSWGENGFGKIFRSNNMCGISQCIAYPTNLTDPWVTKYRHLQLYKHDLSTEARCLDGTPSGLYYSKGFGTGKNKSVVHFMGGAWCKGRNTTDVLTQCLRRSKGLFGSTANWMDALDIDSIFIPSDLNKNANTYNWNRFFVIYCDGTGHQGYRKDPINVLGKDLYFRGHNSTIQALNFILSKLPADLTDTFLLNGCSAGAQAVYTWLQYFNDNLKQLNPNIKVKGFADSGFFLNYTSLITNDSDFALQMQALVQVANLEVDLPNSKCAQDNTVDNKFKCIMAQYLMNYTDTPVYIEQSLYDIWQIQNVLEVGCFQSTDPFFSYDLSLCNETEMIQINKFKEEMRTQILVAGSKSAKNAVYGASCPFHCNVEQGNDPQGQQIQVPMQSGNTVAKTLEMFLNDDGTTGEWSWLDTVNWPDNAQCSGVETKSCSKFAIQ